MKKKIKYPEISDPATKKLKLPLKADNGHSSKTEPVVGITERVTIDSLISYAARHLPRNSNANGAIGESYVIAKSSGWMKRPKNEQMANLLIVLREKKKLVEPSAFDAIVAKSGRFPDFDDLDSLRDAFDDLIFVEIKACKQKRVETSDFAKFYFSFTKNEFDAARVLGEQHQVALVNMSMPGSEILISTVAELLARASSKTWQLSVQLKAVEATAMGQKLMQPKNSSLEKSPVIPGVLKE